ncbi:MAG TPA: hypothetical protein VMF69_04855 [Gemmataceae bacterium]|nr:hypothetical protein [Gemmataceae bacterium]
MLIRKPLPRWSSVSLFVVVVAMIPLIGQARRRSISPPDTLTELAARLSQCTPPLHVVQLNTDMPEGPMWVCARPLSREDLWGLIRAKERAQAGQWQGIVFCERRGVNFVIMDDFIEVWGPYGMRAGPFVLFGDPNLLQRIREVILDR